MQAERNEMYFYCWGAAWLRQFFGKYTTFAEILKIYFVKSAKYLTIFQILTFYSLNLFQNLTIYFAKYAETLTFSSLTLTDGR